MENASSSPPPSAMGNAVGFGKGFLIGVGGGIASLAGGVKDLAVGAYHLGTDSAARADALRKANQLAKTSADYGGKLIDDPATREQAYQQVQQVVANARDQYVAARDAAAKTGQLGDFYGRIAGRGGFEVATLVVPATKLGRLAKVGTAVEESADLVKVAKVARQLPKSEVGTLLTKCTKAEASAAAKAGAAFETLGVARNPMDFPEGVMMVEELRKAGLSPAAASMKAQELVKSGSTLPKPRELKAGEKLYKVVPAGGKPSETTAYWLKASEMDALARNPAAMADKLGLPPGMHVDRYDVFEMAAKDNALVFESKVAGTKVGGVPAANGGATQTLVPDRARFTKPRSVVSIPTKPNTR